MHTDVYILKFTTRYSHMIEIGEEQNKDKEREAKDSGRSPLWFPLWKLTTSPSHFTFLASQRTAGRWISTCLESSAQRVVLVTPRKLISEDVSNPKKERDRLPTIVFQGFFAVKKKIGVVFGLSIGNQKDFRDHDEETALRSLGWDHIWYFSRLQTHKLHKPFEFGKVSHYLLFFLNEILNVSECLFNGKSLDIVSTAKRIALDMLTWLPFSGMFEHRFLVGLRQDMVKKEWTERFLPFLPKKKSQGRKT